MTERASSGARRIAASLSAELDRRFSYPWFWAIACVSLVPIIFLPLLNVSGIRVVAGSEELATDLAPISFPMLTLLLLAAGGAVFCAAEQRYGENQVLSIALPSAALRYSVKVAALGLLSLLGTVVAYGVLVLARGWTEGDWTFDAAHLIGVLLMTLVFSMLLTGIAALTKNATIPIAAFMLVPYVLLPFMERSMPGISELFPYSPAEKVLDSAQTWEPSALIPLYVSVVLGVGLHVIAENRQGA